MKDQTEVCPLSREVMLPIDATSIHSITEWPSLSQSSSIRTTNGFLTRPLPNRAAIRIYHVPFEEHDGLGSASPPVALLSAYPQYKRNIQLLCLLATAFQYLWLLNVDDVYQQFTCVNRTIKPSA